MMRDPKNMEPSRFRELVEQTVDRGSTFDRGLAMWHQAVDVLQRLMVEARRTSGTTPHEMRKCDEHGRSCEHWEAVWASRPTRT
jgi:hypothetical protein